MNIKVANDLIDYAVKKHNNKFVGIPTNMQLFDFHFESKAMQLPKFEKSNMITVNPIK